MANLLSNAIYVTSTDVKETTNIVALAESSDSNIDRYISEAQMIIDSYILVYWCKFDIEQNEIFPIDDDWVALIPDDIKIATIYIVEDIYLSWVPTLASWEEVIEEKVGDHSVKFSENNKAIKFIPEKAKNILDRYKTIFFKHTL